MKRILSERDKMIVGYWGRMPTVEEARKHCANHQGVPPLIPLPKPCRDCAITTGFYTPIASTLSLLPADEVDARCLEWYCHNNPNRACAGNIVYQRKLRAALTSTMREGE